MRQAQLLELSRSSVYYRPQPTSDADLVLMRRIDELHLEHPFAGSRMLRDLLSREGFEVGRKHVTTLMRKMGIEALYRKPRTSGRNREHPVYPVPAARADHRPAESGLGDGHDLHPDAARLRLSDRRPRLGHAPGAGVPGVDQPGRRRRASRPCEEAIARYGVPEIMNTDQGSQFTAQDFIDVLHEHQIGISMDGKGCWRDNVFVERLWRTIKYEHVYLHAYESVSDARAKLAVYIDFYNRRRPHSSIDRRTPDDAYFDRPLLKLAA